MRYPVMMTATMALAAATMALPASAQDRNVFTYAWSLDMEDWDPAHAAAAEPAVLYNIYEPLVWWDADTEGGYRPGLASDWSVDDSGLIWTFNLREGVTFHDGSPMNAEAVKSSFERSMASDSTGYTWMGVTEINAVDDLTVQIVTEAPTAVLVAVSGTVGSFVVAPSASAQGEDWFREGNAVGTGPYTLRQAKTGQQIVLDRYEDYWGGWENDGKEIDRAVFRIVTEASTRVQMLDGGEADMVEDLPRDQIARFEDSDEFDVYNLPTYQSVFWYMNHQKAPTDNLMVRQAIQHLWDRASVASGIYAGQSTPATSTVWSNYPGSGQFDLPAFDIAKAQELIDASGVSEDDLKLSVAYISSFEEWKNICVLFQSNASQVGIEVDCVPGDLGPLWDQAQSPDAFNMFGLIWWPDRMTLAGPMFLQYHSSEAMFNLGHYANTAYDAAVETAIGLEANDPEGSIAAFQQAQGILVDDAAAVWDQEIAAMVVLNSKWEGLTHNPAYNRWYSLRDIRLAD
ncbi:MAG: ABC transporter substrate-binding protein [Paracoccaceae bacterium]